MTDAPSGLETAENHYKQPITNEVKEWSSELDTDLPIDGSDIPDFKSWINWNGFQLDKETGKGHDGYDFAAYLTTDNKIVLGLPSNTPVRAVADGVIAQVQNGFPEITGGGYGVYINIEHGASGSGLFSSYHHVVPSIEYGAQVKKGDVIGTLFKDPDGEEGRLVHLHMMLTNGWGIHDPSSRSRGVISRTVDPGLISEEIYTHDAEPKGNSSFSVPTLSSSEIQIANFQKVRVSN